MIEKTTVVLKATVEVIESEWRFVPCPTCRKTLCKVDVRVQHHGVEIKCPKCNTLVNF